jgi:NADPH-dependent ferric siderophore reductase
MTDSQVTSPDHSTAVERPTLAGPFTTFLTTLAGRAPLTPRMVRLTFAGGDLVDFHDAGPDTFLYLLVPPAGCADLAIDRSFSWDTYQDLPETTRPVGAYYTLRSHRPERAELDVDVFLHEPAGPASAWAVAAPIGAPLALWGPRRLYQPLPSDEHLVLVGDETAVPAIANILESLARGQRATARIEVQGPDDELPVGGVGDVDLAWLHRGDRPARQSTVLLDAVRDLDLAGQVYAWGGGESRAMARIRRHLHQERSVDPSCTAVTAYWRQGDATDDEPPDD